MTIQENVRPIRFGSARKLTRAVTDGPINEPNSDRKYQLGGE